MQSPVIHRGIEQGSEEWINLRLGLITASRFSDVMAGAKDGKERKTRHSYMIQLAAEIVTGLPADGFKSKYMQDGIEREPEAMSFYEMATGYDVERVSFVTNPNINGAGVSPDLLVGDRGLAEFKCPKTETQLKLYFTGKISGSYISQMQGQMMICDRDWCDFVSRDHRINGKASYIKIRVNRDEEVIQKIKAGIAEFKKDLDVMVRKILGD